MLGYYLLYPSLHEVLTERKGLDNYVWQLVYSRMIQTLISLLLEEHLGLKNIWMAAWKKW